MVARRRHLQPGPLRYPAHRVADGEGRRQQVATDTYLPIWCGDITERQSDAARAASAEGGRVAPADGPRSLHLRVHADMDFVVARRRAQDPAVLREIPL